MPKFEPDSYQPVEAYEEALDALHVVASIVLFEFARDGRGTREVIIRNFIARSDMTAGSIFGLWALQDFQGCWVLHRCLLERLFHLRHLSEHDEFEVFEAWSFLEQYKGINRVRSDSEIDGVREHDLFTFTDDQKKRAKDLLSHPPKWRRPKAEAVADGMDMRFLYSYGYDYASQHVHPMANDGDQDFHTITGLTPPRDYPDQRTVLANTVLVGTLVIQEGLNASRLLWRALVYDALDDLRRFVDSGSTDYRQRIFRLASAVRNGMAMCERPEGDSQDDAHD